MMRVTFDGAEDFRKLCQQIPEKLHRGIFLRAFRKGFKPLESAIRSKTPIAKRDSAGNKLASRNHVRGNLRRSIGTIVGKGKKYPTAWTGVRFHPAFDPWYAHFPVGGTRKGVKPNPFVKEAFNQQKATVISLVENELKLECEKIFKRLA